MDDKDRKYLDYFKRLDDSSDSIEPVNLKSEVMKSSSPRTALHHDPFIVVPDDDVPFDAMTILNIVELLDDRKS